MPRFKTGHLTDADPAIDRRCCAVLIVIGTIIALHPVSAHDFWWQLSRGRTVIDGTISPSSTLLAGEVAADADWMGGVLIYLLYSIGATASLMWLKLVAVWAVGIYLLFVASQHRDSLCLAIVLLGLFAARQAWEPASLLFDTSGVILVAAFTDRWLTRMSLGSLVALLATVVVWANTGSLCLLGIFVAMNTMGSSLSESTVRCSLRTAFGVLMLVIISCSATPRGPATLWDSARLLVPSLAASSAFLQRTLWRSLTFSAHQPETIAFVVLSVITFAALFRRRVSMSSVLAFFAIQMLAWSSQRNLAPMSVWLTLMLLRNLQLDDVSQSQALSKKLISVSFRRVFPAVAILAVAVTAVGRWPGSVSRLGWGIDPSISGSAFEESLQGTRTTGSAHCPGVREAGLLCWFHPGGARPFDTPVSALLNGRLPSNVILNEELSTGWQIPHRRDDDSWGGWRLRAQERNTTLLVVPTEDTRLVRALEPTIWKPLSLIGPSLVFGVAGDPKTSPQIARTLQMREHVNQNAWVYSPYSAAGDESHLDFVGIVTDRSTFEADLVFAKTLRAMQLNIAALRVLHPVLRNGSSRIARHEFARNQLELGYNERLTMGQSSLFRATAFLEAATADQKLLVESLNTPTEVDSAVAETVRNSAIACFSGNIGKAILELQENDPELVYARVQLLFEAGRVDEALADYQKLLKQFPDSRFIINWSK